MKYATATYNGPNFLSVVLILMGLLFCLPPILMYSDVPQTMVSLVLAVPMILVGFFLFAQWGTATLQGYELLLKPKLIGSPKSISLATVESIEVKADSSYTLINMRIKANGKTTTLKRISPKKFGALVGDGARIGANAVIAPGAPRSRPIGHSSSTCHLIVTAFSYHPRRERFGTRDQAQGSCRGKPTGPEAGRFTRPKMGILCGRTAKQEGCAGVGF